MIDGGPSTPPKGLVYGTGVIIAAAYHYDALPYLGGASLLGAAIVGMAIVMANRRNAKQSPRLASPDFVLPPGVTDRELEELKRYLKKRRAYTNNELAELLGVSVGEASKRITRAVQAGLVTRERVGKEVAITLH